MPLLKPRPFYKPFEYVWAYQAWETQQKIHWIAEEVPMADDVMKLQIVVFHFQTSQNNQQKVTKRNVHQKKLQQQM